jgi:hypothetical protein
MLHPSDCHPCPVLFPLVVYLANGEQESDRGWTQRDRAQDQGGVAESVVAAACNHLSANWPLEFRFEVTA